MKTYILTVEYGPRTPGRAKVELRSFRIRFKAKNIIEALQKAANEAFAGACGSEEIHGIKLELA